MKKLVVKDIMTKNVITINKNATVYELSKLFLENKISGVPVVDDNNNLVGIATDADIIIHESNLPLPLSFSHAFLQKYESYAKSTKEYLKTKVENIMTSRLKIVYEDNTITKAVNIMINNDINRIPVVDKNNRLKGIITRADIIKFMIKNTE
jgi:CBS domain-containing protein